MTEWYRVLTILHCRIFPTKLIEEEVKFRSYLLIFLFFHWKAIYENAYEGLYKSTENHWNSFDNVNLECQSPLSVFSRVKIVFEFFGGRIISYL